MNILRPVIVHFLKRMLAYLFVFIVVVIVSRRLQLSGNETIVLDGLLALGFAAVGEYRAVRAEFLLAQATGQPSEPARSPEKVYKKAVIASNPSAPARHVSTDPARSPSTPQTATPRIRVKLPISSILIFIKRTLLVGLILFLLGLLFYIPW